MAEDIIENQDSEETSDVKKRGKGKIFKFILIPVVIVVQAVAAYYLVFNFLITKPEKAQTSKSKRQENRVGQFFEIKDMVVNPAGTLGRRFLVIELGLETHNSKLVEEAQTKEIWMRDAIISLLTQKTTDELLDITKRDVLKKEILDLLNSKMSKTKFEKLYFTKYIMQ